MKLFLYRLSLTQNVQADIFEVIEGDGTTETRKDFLVRQFEKDFRFEYRKGIKLRYQHTQTDGDVIAGAICRWISEDVEGDPADPFALTEGGHWEKAAFFFNIGNDQQVFALEQNPRVGLPQSVMGQLLKTINALTESRPYKIDAFSVNTSHSFREAVLSYPGPITSLTFDLVIPNPVDGEGKTKKALKKLRRITNGDRFKSTTTSDEGLKVDNPITRDAAKYAESGGGDIVAKSGTDPVYDSRKTVKVVEIEEKFRPDGTEKDGLSDATSDKLKR